MELKCLNLTETDKTGYLTQVTLKQRDTNQTELNRKGLHRHHKPDVSGLAPLSRSLSYEWVSCVVTELTALFVYLTLGLSVRRNRLSPSDIWTFRAHRTVQCSRELL